MEKTYENKYVRITVTEKDIIVRINTRLFLKDYLEYDEELTRKVKEYVKDVEDFPDKYVAKFLKKYVIDIGGSNVWVDIGTTEQWDDFPDVFRYVLIVYDTPEEAEHVIFVTASHSNPDLRSGMDLSTIEVYKGTHEDFIS